MSDAHPNLNNDWQRFIENNIERIMQHLQIPVVTPLKEASAKSSSNFESNGIDTSWLPDHIEETNVRPQVQVGSCCLLSSKLCLTPKKFGYVKFATVCTQWYGKNDQVWLDAVMKLKFVIDNRNEVKICDFSQSSV